MIYAETAQDQEWRTKAACADLPPSWFFPLQPGGYGRKTGPIAQKAIAKAQGICAGCSVRPECFDYAMETGEGEGIWGGVLFRFGKPQGLRPTNGRAY